MTTDFEERIRQALHAQADQVQPDPRTWRIVSARLRRHRTYRFGLYGAAATAIVVAVVTLPRMADQTRVTFDDSVGTQAPAPASSPTATPTAPAVPAQTVSPSGPFNACGGSEQLAYVLQSQDGPELTSRCYSGPESQFLALGANPAFTPGGDAVVVQRDDPAGPVLVRIELFTGEEQILGAGSWPAISPQGRFAWVHDVAGDGQPPLVLVQDDLFGEPTAEIPVGEVGQEEFTVSHLTWDAGGEHLLMTRSYEGPHAYVIDVAAETGQPVPGAFEGSFAAVAGTGVPGRWIVVERTGGVEGQPVTRAVLATVDVDLPTLQIVSDEAVQAKLDLTPLTKDFNVSADPWIRSAGEAAGQLTWFVGDGTAVLRVGADGTYRPLPPAALVVDNPAFDEAPLDEVPPPDETPPGPAVQDRVTALRAAAIAAQGGDWEPLRALIPEEGFTSNYGGQSDPIAFYIGETEAGSDPMGQLVELLDTQGSIREPMDGERQIFQWGPLTEEFGWRLGVYDDGTPAFFVAGD